MFKTRITDKLGIKYPIIQGAIRTDLAERVLDMETRGAGLQEL